MSLHRSRSIDRLPPPRALTLPTNYTQSTPLHEEQEHSSAVTHDIESFLPSLDESLQDWLSRNVPDITNSPSLFYSLLEDPCPCCKKNNCEHLESLYKNIRKLEVDARLAAEIGQSLLHKHEALIAETNQTKDVLEKQVNECYEKIATLEQLLIDTDNSKLDMMEQRDQSIRKWQKAEQALHDTSLELEKANERCIELGNELKNKTKEVEKLRVFKIMARQADYREDSLRSQLEDTNQELAVSRKNELMLESKYKKLKSRYETVSSSYEKLKQNDNSVGQNTNYQMNTLKESNEKLKNDIIKLTSLIPNSQHEFNDQQPEQAYMLSLIKELALANTKLRMELISKENTELYDINDPIKQDSDILMNDDEYVSRSFMDSYHDGNVFHNETKLEDQILSCNNTLIDENNNNKLHQKVNDSLYTNGNNFPQQQQQPSSSTTILHTDNNTLTESPVPSPSASIPSPSSPTSSTKPDVVHYHFHYHVKNKKRQTTKKNDYAKASKNKTTSNKSTDIALSAEITSQSESSSSLPAAPKDRIICKECNESSPYYKLQLNVSHYLDRLKSTDICSLNRRLRRTFDMMELSNMSNSIIENILTDIKTIQDHFSWVKDKYNINNDSSDDNDNDQHYNESILISAFYPTLKLFQFMLTEIGELRMAMNHLQVDYVKKVEEMDIFVKEDILRKQKEDVKQSISTTTASNVSSSSIINNKKNNKNNTSIFTFDRTMNNSNNNNSSTNNNKSAFSWLSNVFHIQTQNTSSSSPSPSPSSASETTVHHHYKVRYQKSCDSISTSQKLHGDDSDTQPIMHGKLPIMATSCSLRIQKKKKEIDKFGPPSSFPRAITMHNSYHSNNNNNNHNHTNNNNNDLKIRRRSTSIQAKSMIHPLRPSQSTGPKSSKGNDGGAAGWPPTASSSSLTEEVAIQRKRSLLGLGSTSTNADPIDKVSTVDWKLGTSYGSSWLGSNF